MTLNLRSTTTTDEFKQKDTKIKGKISQNLCSEELEYTHSKMLMWTLEEGYSTLHSTGSIAGHPNQGYNHASMGSQYDTWMAAARIGTVGSAEAAVSVVAMASEVAGLEVAAFGAVEEPTERAAAWPVGRTVVFWSVTVTAGSVEAADESFVLDDAVMVPAERRRRRTRPMTLHPWASQTCLLHSV